MQSIEIIAGWVMPFFPMRPVNGSPVKEFADLAPSKDYVDQPKLNGDRVCVGVVKKQIYCQNRHGKWYSYNVSNLSEFLKLPSGTILDGEVYGSNFYPFEAIVVGGKDLSIECPSVRIAEAKKLCISIKTQWLFDYDPKKLSIAPKNIWEGKVRKKLKSKYIRAGSANMANDNWIKNKWG